MPKLIQSDTDTLTIQFSRSEVHTLLDALPLDEMEERLRRMQTVDIIELQEPRDEEKIRSLFPEYTTLSFPLRRFCGDLYQLEELVKKVRRLAEALRSILSTK
jgi:hypothetical protein